MADVALGLRPTKLGRDADDDLGMKENIDSVVGVNSDFATDALSEDDSGSDSDDDICGWITPDGPCLSVIDSSSRYCVQHSCPTCNEGKTASEIFCSRCKKNSTSSKSSGDAPASKKGISFLDALEKRQSLETSDAVARAVAAAAAAAQAASSVARFTDDDATCSVPSKAAVNEASRKAYPPPPPRRGSSPVKTLVPAGPVSDSDSSSGSEQSDSDSDQDLLHLVRNSKGSISETAGQLQQLVRSPPVQPERKVRSPIASALESDVLLEKIPGTKLGLGISETARGLVIANVLPGTPAEKAGITSGQIIAAVNDIDMLKSTKRSCIDLIISSPPKLKLKLVDESRVPQSPGTDERDSPISSVRGGGSKNNDDQASKQSPPQLRTSATSSAGEAPHRKSTESRNSRVQSSVPADSPSSSPVLPRATRLNGKKRSSQGDKIDRKSPILWSVSAPSDKSPAVVTDSESEVNFDSDGDTGPPMGISDIVQVTTAHAARLQAIKPSPLSMTSAQPQDPSHASFADRLANPTAYSKHIRLSNEANRAANSQHRVVNRESESRINPSTPNSGTPFAFLNAAVIEDVGPIESPSVNPLRLSLTEDSDNQMYDTTSFSDPAAVKCTMSSSHKSNDQRRIKLRRNGSGLGLQIVTTSNGTQITQLKPGGPASRSKKIQVGDWVVAVNGMSVVGVDHHDILLALAASAEVELLLQKKCVTSPAKEPSKNSFSQIRTTQDSKRIAFKSMSFTRRLSIPDHESSGPGSPGSQLPEQLYSLENGGHHNSSSPSSAFTFPERTASFNELEAKGTDNGPLEISLFVQPKDRFTHSVPVSDSDIEFVLAWEFLVHNGELEFSLECSAKSSISEKPPFCIAPTVKLASDKVHRASWRCSTDGTYQLQFTNHSNTAINVTLRCTVIDMYPWLDAKSHIRNHGLVRRRSALDIATDMTEEPLFNMEIFELHAMVDWIEKNVTQMNTELIGLLHERENLQDIHDQLDYRAHGLSKRSKSKSIKSTKSGKEIKATKIAVPVETPSVPEPRRVNISPIELPLELSPVMRCGFEYLAQPWALEEVGLFRVSGSLKKILEYEERFQKASVSGKPAELSDCLDPATVCGLMKRAFQKERLPLTPEEGQQLASILLEEDEVAVRDSRFIRAVMELPVNHSCTLKCLIWLFGKIIENEDNKMNATNLGISVGLTVFPTVDLQHCDVMIAYMVENFDKIWPEPLADTPRVAPLPTKEASPPREHVRYY